MFIEKEFIYKGLWYTTLSENTVKTGRIKSGLYYTALENPPKSFESNTINVPEIVSDGTKEYTVVRIGASSFRNLSNAKIESLSPQITHIDFSAFDMILLREFPTELFPRLEYIGILAFASNRLTTVTLPQTVKYIDDAAFCYDTIQEIIIPQDSKYFSKDDKGALYNYRKTRLIWVPSSLTEFNIPFSVQYISRDVFNYNRFQTIVLPPMIKSIGFYAFRSCSYLENVIITGNLFSIDKDAFSACPKLKYIDYYGTVHLPEINFDSENIEMFVCNQYNYDKAFGLNVIKEDNCPAMNIIHKPTAHCRNIKYSTFLFVYLLLN